MENNHLIVMIVAIVAVVGIVAITISAAPGTFSVPLTVSQGSIGTNTANTAGKVTALPAGETTGTKCTTQQYATMTSCHDTYQLCMTNANMFCKGEFYGQQTADKCSPMIAQCQASLNSCLSTACI